MEAEELKRATVEIEGRPQVVDTLVTLLRYIEACGREGTTRWVSLMVDGDGGGQVALRINGQPQPLSAAERGFLLDGDGPVPPELHRQDLSTQETSDGLLLRVELV